MQYAIYEGVDMPKKRARERERGRNGGEWESVIMDRTCPYLIIFDILKSFWTAAAATS